MRGPLRWAHDPRKYLQRYGFARVAQTRGEAPSPSVASLPRPLPVRRGEVKSVHRLQERDQSLEDCLRRGRTAANVQIDGHDVRHPANHGITPGEDSAIGRAIAQRHDPFRIGCGPIGALQSFAHILGQRACHHQHVGVARRCDESQPKTLKIVKGVVERVDFKLAAVAGAGVDLANGEAAA